MDRGLTPLDVPAVALHVARAFERCGIGYVLGGSMASSDQGEPRATNDIDFVVAMTESDTGPLVAALGDEFLVDEAALREAARTGRAWNIVPSTRASVL